MVPTPPHPLVEVRPVANAHNEWIALLPRGAHHAIVADLCLPDHVDAAPPRRVGLPGRRLQLAASGHPGPATLGANLGANFDTALDTTLNAAGVDRAGWRQAQRHAYRWAIQVARNA